MTRQSLYVLLRFELASLAATVADLGVFTTAVWLGLHPVAATPLGAVCGAVTNFLLNRHVTFTDAGGHVSGQAIRYALVSAASLGLNTLGEEITFGVLHLQFLLARVLTGALVGLAWNFPMHRWFVFRRARAIVQPERQSLRP